MRGTKAEFDALLERIRAENPSGDAKAVPFIELDLADAFDKIMFPF